jgi:hypothetical protein
VSDNAEVPLACKRNRPVGDSGTPFRTTPRAKYLNTRRVLSDNNPCEVVKHPAGVDEWGKRV